MIFIHGPGPSGKSAFMDALLSVMGDYAMVANFETFLKRRDVGSPRPDIARTVKARMVVTSEVDQGQTLSEGTVKSFTGGDTMTVRKLYGSEFEFKPQCTVWMVANHAPLVRDDDSAMWRRIVRVPFNRLIPKDKRDPTIKATLCNPAISGPAILAWMVQGCIEWQRNGLGVPKSVEAATEEYRKEQDPLSDFFNGWCVFDPKIWTTNVDMRAAYARWAYETGEKYLVGGKEWSNRLRAEGCVPHSERPAPGDPVKRGWKGIGLIN